MKSTKNHLHGTVKIYEDFEKLIADFVEKPYPAARGIWSPLYDLFITRNRLMIIIEIPGVDKDNINVSISSQGVLVRGRREAPKMVREGQVFYNLGNTLRTV